MAKTAPTTAPPPSLTDDTAPLDAPPLPIELTDAPPAPDLPPARPRRSRPPAGTPRNRSRSSSKPPAIDLAAKLTELLTLGGMVAGMANPIDGLIITNNAAQLAGALDALARENEQVRRVLTGLVTGSAWGAVIMAAGSIALPIAANHGAKVPAGDKLLQPYRQLMDSAAPVAG